jgi:hypothetical protein
MTDMRHRVARILLLIVASAILGMLAASSRSDSAGRVWGHVSYQGRPVTSGAIVFAPVGQEAGQSTMAKIGQNGLYSLDSKWRRRPNVKGHYKIAILDGSFTFNNRNVANRWSTRGEPSRPGDDEASPAPHPSVAGRQSGATAFPVRFTDTQTSGLQVTLGVEPTRVDVDLSD